MDCDGEALTRPPFIQTGYYTPLVLANGVDYCQVDFSGSMAFKDLINGLFSFWYKKGRPHGPDPLGIVKLSYRVHSDKGPVEVADFVQHFDARRAVLLSRVSGYGFTFEITTFLTTDHTLVEVFDVCAWEAAEGGLDFSLTFPTRSYSNKPVGALIAAPQATVSTGLEDGAPAFRYRYAAGDDCFEGIGISRVRAVHGKQVTCCTRAEDLAESGLGTRVGGLHAGDRLVRVTTVLDSRDADDWEAQAKRLQREYACIEPAVMQARHEAAIEGDESTASFDCSEPACGQLFDVSAYVCRASLHPNGSSVSALAHPNSHGMGTYWDIWYVHRGLLAAGRTADARRIVDFWLFARDPARQLARERYGTEGARYAWVLRCDGRPFYDIEQLHNNLIPVFTVWDQYAYTQQAAILELNFELMEDCVRFIVQHALRREADGRPYLKELTCVDESEKMKRNCLATAITTRHAIELLHRAGSVLGREPAADLAAAAIPLEQILADLSATGVYRSYEDADGPGWAVLLAYLHAPDPGGFGKALPGIMEELSEAHGLGAGRSSRMRCATFPWIEGILAWTMARNGHPDALTHLEGMTRYRNFYGGLPEYVWQHGEPSRDWFVAAHGVFPAALAESLFRVDGDVLEVLPLGTENLPWERLSCVDLRLPGAIRASLDVDRGESLALRVTADAPGGQVLGVKVGGTIREHVTLKPNQPAVFETDLD